MMVLLSFHHRLSPLSQLSLLCVISFTQFMEGAISKQPAFSTFNPLQCWWQVYVHTCVTVVHITRFTTINTQYIAAYSSSNIANSYTLNLSYFHLKFLKHSHTHTNKQANFSKFLSIVLATYLWRWDILCIGTYHIYKTYILQICIGTYHIYKTYILQIP